MRAELTFLLGHWKSCFKLRFLVVGGVNTILGYLMFLALYIFFGAWLGYLGVAVSSHLVSVCFAFYMQRRIVFYSSAPWLEEFLRYNLSVIGIVLAGLGGLYILVSVLGLHPLVGQAIVVCASIVGSYIAHRHFSFGSD